MRTLSTSFSDALKKDQNRKHAMIFRVEAEEVSTGDSKVFYFSNDWEEVDFTVASGVISRYGAIKETIDFYNNSYSYGGFDLSIVEIQDKINDLLSNNYVINRKVEIYYWIEGQDKRTNQDINFNGTTNFISWDTPIAITAGRRIEWYGKSDNYSTSYQGICGYTTNNNYSYIRFDYQAATQIIMETDTNSDSVHWIGLDSLDDGKLHKIVLENVGSGVWELFIDDISQGNGLATSSNNTLTIDVIGCARTPAVDLLDGKVGYFKVFDTDNSLMLHIVSHNDEIMDITGNYNLTEGGTFSGFVDNLKRMYKGIISDKRNENNMVVLPIENDTAKLERQFPGIINDPNAGDANGKVAQLVYGDHSTNYGSTNPSQKNNMVKGVYCGTSAGTNGFDTVHRWIVAGNGSDVTIAASGGGDPKVWFWDSSLNRYTQLLDYTVGTDAQGNKYIEIESAGDYICYAYDFMYPIYFEESGGTPTWENGYNVIGVPADYAEIAFSNELINNILFCYLPNNNNYTIVEKVLQGAGSSRNVEEYTISGFNETVDVASNPIFNKTVTGDIPERLIVTALDIGMAVGYARLNYMCVRLKYEVTEIKDLYVECSNSVDTQREIISDLCDKADINYTDNTDVTACTIAPVLDQQKDAINWIKEVAYQGACVPFVNANNELSVDKIDTSATADKVIYPDDIQVDSLEVEETSLSDLSNNLNVSYKHDNYSGGNTEVSTSSDTGSQNQYNITKEKVIDASFYQDEPTTLISYWGDGSHFTKKRATFNLRTCGIVGSVPYDGSGNFEPLCALEKGDHVSLDASFDSIKKCNNESWSGKVFKIIEYNMEIGYIEMKGLEVA